MHYDPFPFCLLAIPFLSDYWPRRLEAWQPAHLYCFFRGSICKDAGRTKIDAAVSLIIMLGFDLLVSPDTCRQGRWHHRLRS